MKTEKILKPGQPGTKKCTEKFGDSLICVRYKIDKIHNRRLKTAEIIIDEKQLIFRRKRIPANKLVPLKVDYNNTYLRKLVKYAGGKWDSDNKVWELPYNKVMQLGLEKNMLDKE
jgi:hypothetical protein